MRCALLTILAVMLLLVPQAGASIEGSAFVDDGGYTLTDLLQGNVSSLTASRSSNAGGGIFVNPVGAQWDNGNFEVNLVITNNGGGSLHYSYSLGFPLVGKPLPVPPKNGNPNYTASYENISHSALAFSENVFTYSPGNGKPDGFADPNAFTNFEFNGVASNDFTIGDGTYPLGGTSPVIKFNDTDNSAYTIEFDSNRVPVFSSLFVKDGDKAGDAMTQGLADLAGFTTVDLDDPLSWIGAPDSDTVPIIIPQGDPDAPEPGSLLVWSTIALGVCGLVRGRRHPIV